MQVPADATIGFLPPNTTSPMGEGYLTYTVRPNANSANGTVIDALASIIFDGQQTINTPLYTNTIDIAAPTSTMNALGATQTSTTFNISWTGTDDAGQSGIQGYDIYVSDNGGPYNIFLADTTNTTASFTGVNGHTYRFKSVAYDNLGFVQLLPANAQTTTTIQESPDRCQLLRTTSRLSIRLCGPQISQELHLEQILSLSNHRASPRRNWRKFAGLAS
ncbi:MAG: hypothetical protein EBV16_10015 [Betaproteobacteria bacterium]|nr:hypothetical protein [Betaproteobacteria bacterium]